MRVLKVIVFSFVSFPALGLAQHWSLTADETIWRGEYTNGSRCYAVELPAGVVAHSSLPPSPNHGFLIAALAPGTTTEVTLDADRLVGVYDSYDSAEYGSARAYAKQLLEWEGSVEVLAEHRTKFQGLPAMYVHFRKKEDLKLLETEEIVVYRRSKVDSPILYVVWMRSSAQNYASDRKLYEQIRSGFRILRVVKSGCSSE
jgi:hypothetical protein